MKALTPGILLSVSSDRAVQHRILASGASSVHTVKFLLQVQVIQLRDQTHLLHKRTPNFTVDQFLFEEVVRRRDGSVGSATFTY